MWEQYKRTFVFTQVVIVFITCLAYLGQRQWPTAALLFLVMQVGAVVGAVWAARLRRTLSKTEVQ
jgi:uncharacterized membrane protein YfcA